MPAVSILHGYADVFGWHYTGAVKKELMVLAFLGVQTLHEARADDDWQFTVTPYLWLPSVDARLGFEAPGSGGSSAEMTNLLEHLRAALFLNGSATRGKWGLSVDFVYCDFSKSSSQVTSIDVPGQGAAAPVNTGTTTGLTGSMLSLSGNYALKRSSNSGLDLLAGVRYTHVAATLDWSFTSAAGPVAGTGSAELSTDLWDGVVGIRGRLGAARSSWFVPLYLDAGAGTSKFTWQGMLGVGYAFRWGDLLAVYRELAFDGDDSAGLEHLRFSGPAIGATFRL
jgi:hypothetical protein